MPLLCLFPTQPKENIKKYNSQFTTYHTAFKLFILGVRQSFVQDVNSTNFDNTIHSSPLQYPTMQNMRTLVDKHHTAAGSTPNDDKNEKPLQKEEQNETSTGICNVETYVLCWIIGGMTTVLSIIGLCYADTDASKTGLGIVLAIAVVGVAVGFILKSQTPDNNTTQISDEHNPINNTNIQYSDSK